MGAGKSSVGRQLARKLKRDFYDSDREIEARCGVDIPTIFEYEGEAGFRERESAVLDELTAREDIVLATGGGSILSEANRKLLSDRGTVILLSVELQEQLRRISLNANRPLLQTADPEATLVAIMKERAPLYQALADIEINTNSSRMQNVINRLLKELEKQGHLPAGTSMATTTASRSKKTAQAKTGKKRAAGSPARTKKNSARRKKSPPSPASKSKKS